MLLTPMKKYLPMFVIISMMMSLPRQAAFDVSPCQTGA
jgi:hypothetical protein